MANLTDATEQSTYPVFVDLKDSNGVSITPNNDVTWTLSDDRNNVINSRLNVSYTPASSSFTIVLSGDDLLMQSDEATEERYLIVRCTYNSSLGTGLPFVGQVKFKVNGVHVVS